MDSRSRISGKASVQLCNRSNYNKTITRLSNSSKRFKTAQRSQSETSVSSCDALHHPMLLQSSTRPNKHTNRPTTIRRASKVSTRPPSCAADESCPMEAVDRRLLHLISTHVCQIRTHSEKISPRTRCRFHPVRLL